MSSINWNAVSSVVSALSTLGLLYVTWRYVRLTSYLVEEARLSRTAILSIDFEIRHDDLVLVISNHGGSPAKNIRLELLKDVPLIGLNEKRGISGLPAFKSGILYLAPKRSLKYRIGYLNMRRDFPDDAVISIRMTYDNIEGKSDQTTTIDYDVKSMIGAMLESFRDPTLAVAEAIRETANERRSERGFEDILKTIQNRPQKPCPICAEMIFESAKKCPKCHELFS